MAYVITKRGSTGLILTDVWLSSTALVLGHLQTLPRHLVRRPQPIFDHFFFECESSRFSDCGKVLLNMAGLN